MQKQRKSKAGCRKWLILAVAIVLGFVLSLMNFLVWSPSKEYARATVDLLYDGATSGLAPNGEVFLIDNLKDEELLTAAIQASGLTDRITPQELSRNLVIRGSYPNDIIEQIKAFDSLLAADPTRQVRVEEYHPTNYSVYIYNQFANRLTSAQLQDLLTNVLSEYKSLYTRLYSAGIDWDTSSRSVSMSFV